MYTVLVIVQVLAAVALVGLILLQQGKGADAGAAFGSGASGTVFGSRGAANFLSRTTAWLAAVFFSVSLALAYIVHGRATTGSIVDQMAAPKPAVPAAVQIPGLPTPGTSPAANTSAPAVPAPGAPVPAAPVIPPEAAGTKPDAKSPAPTTPAPAKVPE